MTPTFQGVDPLCWPAQICPIVNGTARYTNWGSDIITCPKYAHFTIDTALEQGKQQDKGSSKQHRNTPPLSVDQILQQLRINDRQLTSQQKDVLDAIHRENISVFDSDLSGGYNHRMGKYEVSFVFKDSSKPPPLKVWAPHYNKS